MNADKELQYLTSELEQLNYEFGSFKKRYEIAHKFTQKFLNECGKAGYTRISIGKKHPSIPQTTTWPFGYNGSVFAWPEDVREIGWPSIWRIVDRLKINGGCGNSHQHQIDTSKLLDGVYHLKNGNWIKVEAEEE
jgi:hypothetical protein